MLQGSAGGGGVGASTLPRVTSVTSNSKAGGAGRFRRFYDNRLTLREQPGPECSMETRSEPKQVRLEPN